jgi:hypothetical protein
MGNKAAVNRLDEESGSKIVAKTKTDTPAVAEVPVSVGGPWRTRTSDPLIKSDGEHRIEENQDDPSPREPE